MGRLPLSVWTENVIKDIFLGRKTFFHVHTVYTDGEDDILSYLDFLKSYPDYHLVFLEHIRREPGYDPYRFIREVEQSSFEMGVPERVHIGFEAKVLPWGKLDIPSELLSHPRVEFVGVAEHGFDGSFSLLEESLKKIFRFYSMGGYELVWVHPGLTFLKKGFRAPLHFYMEVLADADVLVEFNLKYWLPCGDVLKKLFGRWEILVGMDAHSVDDVRRYLKKILQL